MPVITRGLTVAAIIAVICSFPSVHAEAKGKYEWFWFLYEKENISAFPSTMITPFYFTSVNGKEIYTASLPPFFFTKYETEHSITRFWALGLANDIDYRHSDNVRDYDLGVMPFLLYGNSPVEKDRYLFVWPVGGEIKGKLGMEYINPWIFPGVALFFIYPPSSWFYIPLYIAASVVPVYTSYGRADYKAQAILWPLIQWGESPIQSDFRILPFYAHNSRKDRYDNRSWLLLFNYDRTFYKGGRELDTAMFFPIITRRWMSDGSAEASSLFWPFFSWGYNKRQGDLEINFPWPLIIYQRSEDPYIRKKIFFPFYGNIKYGDDETEFITPLYISLKRDNKTFSSEYYITAFIIWYFKRDYKNNPSVYYGKQWNYFKIWPLLRYESNDKGDVHFNMLSLLPLRDPGGYEKIYDPLWSIVEYHKDKDVRRFGLLLRTYYQCWDEKSFRMQLGFIVPIFTYASYNGSVRECTLLFSMLGYENKKKGSYVRLFWIPLRIGDGAKDEAALEESLSSEEPEYAPPYESVSIRNDIVLGSVRI